MSNIQKRGKVDVRPDTARLPPTAGLGDARFISQEGSRGDKLFILPDSIEYAGALDPTTWQVGSHMDNRAYPVTSDVSGKRVELIVRHTRSTDDPAYQDISDVFSKPREVESILKAQLIWQRLRHEDADHVIGAEKPLGFVRAKDGSETGVYLKLPDVTPISALDGPDLEDAEKAREKYLRLSGDAGGWILQDRDHFKLDNHLLYKKGADGRGVLVKIDSEFVQPVNIADLRVRAEKVDAMLKAQGFDPAPYDGIKHYSSPIGHNVAVRMIDATILMNPSQEAEFHSPEVAGRLALAVRSHTKAALAKDARGGGDLLQESMGRLSVILKQAGEVVADKRSGFVRDMAGALEEAKGEESEFMRRSSQINSGYPKITPLRHEKEGIVRPYMR
ncbi:hypothetical protein ACFLRF_02005 [Candidatus Altiarchaeota archaeon]